MSSPTSILFLAVVSNCIIDAQYMNPGPNGDLSVEIKNFYEAMVAPSYAKNKGDDSYFDKLMDYFGDDMLYCPTDSSGAAKKCKNRRDFKKMLKEAYNEDVTFIDYHVNTLSNEDAYDHITTECQYTFKDKKGCIMTQTEIDDIYTDPNGKITLFKSKNLDFSRKCDKDDKKTDTYDKATYAPKPTRSKPMPKGPKMPKMPNDYAPNQYKYKYDDETTTRKPIPVPPVYYKYYKNPTDGETYKYAYAPKKDTTTRKPKIYDQYGDETTTRKPAVYGQYDGETTTRKPVIPGVYGKYRNPTDGKTYAYAPRKDTTTRKPHKPVVYGQYDDETTTRKPVIPGVYGGKYKNPIDGKTYAYAPHKVTTTRKPVVYGEYGDKLEEETTTRKPVVPVYGEQYKNEYYGENKENKEDNNGDYGRLVLKERENIMRGFYSTVVECGLEENKNDNDVFDKLLNYFGDSCRICLPHLSENKCVTKQEFKDMILKKHDENSKKYKSGDYVLSVKYNEGNRMEIEITIMWVMYNGCEVSEYEDIEFDYDSKNKISMMNMKEMRSERDSKTCDDVEFY